MIDYAKILEPWLTKSCITQQIIMKRFFLKHLNLNHAILALFFIIFCSLQNTTPFNPCHQCFEYIHV